MNERLKIHSQTMEFEPVEFDRRDDQSLLADATDPTKRGAARRERFSAKVVFRFSVLFFFSC